MSMFFYHNTTFRHLCLPLSGMCGFALVCWFVNRILKDRLVYDGIFQSLQRLGLVLS